MSAIDSIMKSFREELRNFSDLSGFVYTESSVNIEESIQGRVKNNLIGTETVFPIEYDYKGFWYGVKNNRVEQWDFQKRYIKITLSGVVKYFLISSINKTSNEITILSPFGEAVTPSNTFEIVILDSIFLRDIDDFDVGGNQNSKRSFLRIDMEAKTKEDSNKSKIRNIVDQLKCYINSNFQVLKIYDDTFTNILGHANFGDQGSYVETVDSAEQLRKVLGSVGLTYSIRYI